MAVRVIKRKGYQDILYDDETGQWVEASAGPEGLAPTASTGLKDYAKNRQLLANLALYDKQAQKYREDLTRLFGQQTELNVARQQAGVQSNLAQFLQRRGIAGESGLAASLTASTQGRLASEASQTQANFSTRLLSAMQQQRDAFINGEFDFFRRIDLMGYEAQLQKDLMRFQAKLNSDLSARDLFLGTVGTLGALFGGPVGAAVGLAGSAAATATGRNQYAYGPYGGETGFGY